MQRDTPPPWTTLPFPALECVAEALPPADVYRLVLTCREPFFTTRVAGRVLATHLLSLSVRKGLARELASDPALQRAVEEVLRQGLAMLTGSSVLRGLHGGRWACGDVDLVCEGPDAARARSLIAQHLCQPESRYPALVGPYSRLVHVDTVYKWERAGRRKVDLVVTGADTTIARLLDSFDIAACRCTWDGRRACVVDPHMSFAMRSAYNPAHIAFLRHVQRNVQRHVSPRQYGSIWFVADRAQPRAVELLCQAGIELDSGYYAVQWARQLLGRVYRYRERGLRIELDDDEFAML